MWISIVLSLLVTAADAPAAPAVPPAAPVAPAPREIAPGTYLMAGAILPNRGPDGNTVMFTAPRGLVVVDTGRHAWHSDGILAFARERKQPVVAIVNTHWHLDHSSGNVRVKAAYPNARVYTTNAIDRALGPRGFLTRNAEGLAERVKNPEIPEAQRAEMAVFAATMEASASLRPDVVITETGRRELAGRPLDVHVTDGAVTDADVWLYDPRTRVAVIGDLVTFPAPFFETACPKQWSQALDSVWATPFRIAVPGHGEPMTRAQFGAYRDAFHAFVACVNDTAATGCPAIWTRGVAQFLGTDAARGEASDYAGYYVGYLRKNGGKSPDCLK